MDETGNQNYPMFEEYKSDNESVNNDKEDARK
jgi:hypothetical protein